MTDGLTRSLVSEVRSLRFEEIPEEARECARHTLLDFLGCALAGAREPLTEILVRQVVALEGGDRASLIGRPERATPQTAALVNGAAGHALDYDDTHAAMGGHPSVPMLPALLAVAEDRGADGRALLTALVAGFELESRVGQAAGPGHYAAGFHTTGTVGTFGAAAACAHLIGLDEAAWLHALGLAGTQAAGLKSGFGTMAKPLHAGRAAANGLLAATLAAGGFTAQPAVLEMPQGFLATHAGRDPAELPGAPDHLHVRDTLFKYHAACYLTHAAIEALARLRREHALDPEKVERVEIEVHPVLLGVCHIPEPSTGLEGKFSLRLTAAFALLGRDTGDPELYSDAGVRAPEVVALRDRVQVKATDAATPELDLMRVASAAVGSGAAPGAVVLGPGRPAALDPLLTHGPATAVRRRRHRVLAGLRDAAQHRYPVVDAVVGEREPGGHDADDDTRPVVQRDRRSDDRGITPEVALPGTMAEQDHAVVAVLFLVGGERATVQRIDPQQREQRRRGGDAVESRRLVEARHGGRLVRVHGELCERVAGLAPVQEQRLGRVGLLASAEILGTELANDRDGTRIVVRQRPQQHAVDDAEDRRVGADRQRQRDHDDRRIRGALAQRAHGLAQVLHQGHGSLPYGRAQGFFLRRP